MYICVCIFEVFSNKGYTLLSHTHIYIYIYIVQRRHVYVGESLITDPLLILTSSRISVTIRGIKQLYIHELLVI